MKAPPTPPDDPTPKRRGRPPRADGAATTSLGMVRVSEAEIERWREAARASGTTLAEWVRTACDVAAARQGG